MKNTLSDKLLDVDFQRKITKNALAASVAVLAITALAKGKTAKNIHTFTGVALVGLSVWHAELYGNGIVERFLKNQKRKLKQR